MSRHRKVKALNYEDEYDDLYGDYDDDEDFDEEDFEAKFLSSGIDLSSSASNNISRVNESRQKILDEINSRLINSNGSTNLDDSVLMPNQTSNPSTSNSLDRTLPFEDQIKPCEKLDTELKSKVDTLTSDLTQIAIKHLDKHQWQLPLMEMDKKFRDRTYYKHYTDTYITSLRSKLGHFLADSQLLCNPMKHHMQQELDNYHKYSRMFELLTDYYKSLDSGFFSFATPSPDEEIVIGCKLGTKAKKPVPKVQSKVAEGHTAARFEYHGKPLTTKPSTSKQNNKQAVAAKTLTDTNSSSKFKTKDLTIQENFTAEHLDKLSKKYNESLKIDNVKNNEKVLSNKAQAANHSVKASSNSGKKTTSSSQPKQLATLVEKRHILKQQLKRNAEPSQQDKEMFKRQALETTREYNELQKCSRTRINLVVVGHVDAGKSTLVGHLLYKLGQVSGKQMHRNEVDSQRSGKASFKYAWALDETAEERARGVTIDIALTQFETPNRDVVLLDAPGHVDFIPAVISGAAQADAALLVVNATRGEFETGFNPGGQTREHTFLVRSLGVKSLIVVVNKMDSVNWSWTRFGDIVDQLKPFLKQAGFDTRDDVQFVVCSGLTGENLTERRIDKALKQSSHPQLEGDGGNWSSMPSLLEAIDKIKQPERAVDKPTRVCITDVFKGMSSGVFLGGKVVGGKIEGKQKLILLPTNETCDIKQVEVRDSKAKSAFAGDIVTIVSTGIDINKYYRGCMLSDPLIPCKVTNRFQARIIMFQNVNALLVKGSPIEVHINGTYESGEIRRLISLLNKSSGELVQRKPRCVAKNSSAIVQFKLARVVCCELYEDNKDLGRFMVRSFGKTIAAGLITKIKSPKVEKNRTKLKTK